MGGKRGWEKEISDRVVSDKVTFLWGKGGDLLYRWPHYFWRGNFQIDWLKVPFPGEDETEVR